MLHQNYVHFDDFKPNEIATQHHLPNESLSPLDGTDLHPHGFLRYLKFVSSIR
jgi:hypothetical protein